MAALPNTGITTSMVASAIGAATNDVGSLCKHSNVNKWSKWKPVIKAKVTGLTESDLSDAHYGFTVPYENAAGADTLSASWVYDKPTGGSSSPYRLGDFRNYLHSSKIPYSFLIPNYIIKGGGTTLVKMTPSSSLDTGNLTCTDLFANMYFGVMIVKGDQVRYKTATTKIPDGVSTINIADCSLVQDVGTISIYCFYTASQITSWTSTAEQIMYSLNGEGGISYKTVDIVVPEETEYILSFNVLAADRTAIVLSNTYAANGLITAVGTVTRTLANSYVLNKVRVLVVRTSDNTIVYDQLHDPDTNTSPIDLLAGELEVSMQIGFASTMYVTESDFDPLPINDHYRISYILQFNKM